MPALLEKFRSGISQVFNPIREADEREQKAAVENYDDLVVAFASAIHRGEDHGLDTEDVTRIRDAAGKTPEQMEIDVSKKLEVLANADVIAKAKEHEADYRAAIAEKKRLEEIELPAAKKRVEDVRNAIADQNRIIRRQGTLNVARQQAEAANIDACQDYRRQQRDELKTWMMSATGQLRTLREDRDRAAGRLAEMESELEKHVGKPLGDLPDQLAETRQELAELDEQITDLQAKWDEAKSDHRQIVESMKHP